MKFTILMATSLFVSSLAFAQSEYSELYDSWKGFSDPEIMASGFTHAVSELPLEGTVIGTSTIGWSGPYWASKQGGVNIRWNSPKQEKFDYKSPSRAAVMSMSQEQLATLAATEKYDLFLGRYDYPVKTEAEGTASKMARDWAGICHGWAPASLHHKEPTPKVMTNPDGLKIPFGSGDIKALISYYYAFYTENAGGADSKEESAGGQIGLRCFFGSWLGGTRACSDDLNAGAFHIVIANKLGLRKEGLLMDADRFREVWNQPVLGFKTVVLNAYLPRSSKAAKNAVREMRVSTELFYANESDATWDVVYGTKNQVIAKKDLQYRLEISADGKIVGGEWESEDRPDFLWDKAKVTTFDGLFSRLPELLND